MQAVNSPVGPDSLEASDPYVYNKTLADMSGTDTSRPPLNSNQPLSNPRGQYVIISSDLILLNYFQYIDYGG